MAAALAPAVARAADAVVSATEANTWDPSSVSITAGDQVTWEMAGGEVHNVQIRAGSLEDPGTEIVTSDTSSQLPDGEFSWTFDTPGPYSFVCQFHPGMEGEVTVSGGGEDTVAPLTNASLSPASPGPGGTYSGPVTITPSATDVGSGVASTEYSIDDTPFQAYSTPFAVSGTGAHTVKYRSTDIAGNVETPKQVGFSIQPVPSAEIEIGKVTRKPNGTASVAVDASVAGTLSVAGKGVRSASKETEGGTTKLTVAATGKAKRTLERKGKVKVEAKFTLDPETGEEAVASIHVKLVKKRR